MSTPPDNRRLARRVAVVGGGIAGLAAAYRLQELARTRGLALELLLLEAGQRIGGAIATERVDDFLIEAGIVNKRTPILITEHQPRNAVKVFISTMSITP